MSTATPSGKLVSLRKKTPERQADAVPVTGKLYMETYGCQMNVADSQLLSHLLRKEGLLATEDVRDADVILVNTCAVRERAEDRVYARLAELKNKRKNSDVVLGVVGCMAEHLKEKIVEKIPDVNLVAGPDSYRRAGELIREAHGGGTQFDTKLDKKETYEGVGELFQENPENAVSAFVTVQRGCDKFCTFCVVPFTRGRERGVAPREVLRQVRSAVSQGYREITLLGQTVNSYKYEDVTFSQLLVVVADVPGVERVRFTSPYPVDFTDELVQTIAKHPKICNQVHLPIQSGADTTLERMKRGYTVQDFLDIVERLRQAIPDIGFSTDILSGFSGETEDEHQETLELMKTVQFDTAFMFMYSERGPTYAAKKLPDDVPVTVKKRRLNEIIALQKEISLEKHRAKVGTEQVVLFSGPSKRSPKQWVGRADDFKSVIVDREWEGGTVETGETYRVRITDASMATLFGEIISPME